jgi:lipoprotein-anchoring transpeptidase ErfK/SrfK
MMETGTMLRRNFLKVALNVGVPLGMAVTLGTSLLNAPLTFADELNSAAAPAGNAWRGVVKASGATLRSAPSNSATAVADLAPGTNVDVDKWVAGTEVYPTLITWGHLADGSGFVYGSALQPHSMSYALPINLPAELAGATGKWIDVNLTQNQLAAVEGQSVRNVYPTSPGRPGFETTRGLHHVRYQLSSDNMAGPGYLVRGVRWVNYFLPDGEAIHARTWDVDAITFGVPSSHGCLGVPLDAAAALYQFVSPGTPVYVHD